MSRDRFESLPLQQESYVSESRFTAYFKYKIKVFVNISAGCLCETASEQTLCESAG